MKLFSMIIGTVILALLAGLLLMGMGGRSVAGSAPVSASATATTERTREPLPVITAGNASSLSAFGQFLLGTEIHDLDWSPASGILAIAGYRLWLIDSYASDTPHQMAEYGAFAIAFHPSEPLLGTGGNFDGKVIVEVWNTASGKREHMFELPYHQFAPVNVYGIAFSPDGELLATVDSGMWVRVWDWRSGEEVYKLNSVDLGMTGGGGDLIYDVAFSPNGQTIAFGHDGADELHAVYLWRYASHERPVRLEAERSTFFHRGGSAVTTIDFSPDGATLATGGHDGTVRIWRLEDGTQEKVINAHRSGIEALAFNATGDVIASGGLGEQIQVWDVASGELLAQFDFGDMVADLDFSADGTVLAAGGSYGTLRFWSVAAE